MVIRLFHALAKLNLYNIFGLLALDHHQIHALRCDPQFLQLTSVLSIPYSVSEMYSMLSSDTGSQKLGQPEPESNFAFDENNSFPQQTHLKEPSSLLSLYFPENGGSVPCLIQISY